MSVSASQVQEVAQRLGKSERTIWRWVKAGCDLSEESISDFQQARAATSKAKAREQVRESISRDGVTPAQPVDSRAVLKRLKEIEASMHARLQAAIKTGKAYSIAAARDDLAKGSRELETL